ncbi:Hypothetical predicted protein [Mytilus galloprovincialis]|uniref:Vitelline membrane outer layer 1-like protein n=1 Tax=Mytilus galloprovincialis TaxID=29158 RepID=A0A8B6E1P9_MYTGA|nr:Hypothetical predicted protein [Mytilus galloprovincialis]
MFITRALVLVICVAQSNSVSRNVVKELSVTNGQGWGDWRNLQLCPQPGQYAYGYKMRIEVSQGGGRRHDDTSLNAIQLLCGTKTVQHTSGPKITSGTCPWGDWYPTFTQCRPGEFFVSFSLKVEGHQGAGRVRDDTAANYVKFECRGLNGGYQEIKEQPRQNGYGDWGTYGSWSRSCDTGSAICGIQTRTEPPQGSGTDDTALNDVKFVCCRD